MAAAAKVAPAVTLSQALARIKKLEAENRKMREMLKWESDVFALPNVKAADKILWVVTRREEEYQRQRQGVEEADTGPVDMSRPALSKRTGASVDAISDGWKSLKDMGVIEYKRRHVTNKETGEKIQQVSICLTDTARKDPRALAPVEARMQGGRPDRKHCKECGSEHLRVHVQVVCADCGAVVEARERFINPPEEAAEEVKGQLATLVPDTGVAEDPGQALDIPGLVPAVTPAKGSPKYCPNTIDNRHRYGNFRTADYRRICQYCATPEEKPYLTTVQARRIAAKVL